MPRKIAPETVSFARETPFTGPEFDNALNELKLNDRQFAETFGIHRQTVYRWRAGVLDVPLWATCLVKLYRDRQTTLALLDRIRDELVLRPAP